MKPLRVRRGTSSTGANGESTLLLVWAALAAPLILRALLCSETGSSLGLGDMRGAFSDLTVALGIAAIAGLLARIRRPLALSWLLLWALLCYGNYEHVRANDANMALRYVAYLADETFLRGSAIDGAQPLLLVGSLLLALGLGIAATRSSVRLRVWGLVFSFGFAVIAHFLWSASPDWLGWRQSNFAAQNLAWSLRGETLREPPAREEVTLERIELAAPDLAGEPIVPFGGAKQNVLLVMFEGVSGAYLEPIAAANDRRPPGISMSELSRVAGEGVAFTSFISHQRQTNRGEYGVLCGELPRLVSMEAKMTEIAARPGAGGKKRCLPAALAEAGYATVYLQAAPMAFMLKDRFMPKIGFERSLGDTYFKDAYSRTKWGVDDRAFLEQSLGMIDELRAADRPWFLTLLTAGTHHPQNVPLELLEKPGVDRRRVAFRYLDAAIGEFVDALEAKGILEDTLVLLTSDESQGVRRGVNDTQKRLSQSWGFLIALVPGAPALRVDVPQAQIDIALSTLDWLGLSDRAAGFSGRSVFRRYSTPRVLAFGNTYFNRVGGVNERGRLVMCEEDLQRCMHADTEDQRLFKRGLTPLPEGSVVDATFLRQQVDGSLRISGVDVAPGDGATSSAVRDLSLADGEMFRIRDDVDDLQWVFGGQYLTAPENSRIDVDLEVELVGESGRVELQHALKTEVTDFFAQKITDMKPGDRVHMRYSYSTVERLHGVGNYLIVTRQAGSGLHLKMPRARMQIRPGARTDGPPLVVHEFEVKHLERKDEP